MSLHWVHTAPLPHPCCRGDREAAMDLARMSPKPGDPSPLMRCLAGSGRRWVGARALGSVTSALASCPQDFLKGTSDRAPSSEDLSFLIYKWCDNTTHRMTTQLTFVRDMEQVPYSWSVCLCVHVCVRVRVYRCGCVFSSDRWMQDDFHHSLLKALD